MRNRRYHKVLRSRGLSVCVALAALVTVFAGNHPIARAHDYCKACVRTCFASPETGCEVRYPNTGVYTKSTCNGGGTACTMTYTTPCYTMKKVCTYSVCINNDCESTACTTYPLTTKDGSTTYSGDSACNG